CTLPTHMGSLVDILVAQSPAWLRPRLLDWFGYTVVHTAPLPDGVVRVITRGTVRHLRFGESGEDQSALDVAEPLRHVLPYTSVATLGLALPPRLEGVLHLGLG